MATAAVKIDHPGNPPITEALPLVTGSAFRGGSFLRIPEALSACVFGSVGTRQAVGYFHGLVAELDARQH